jgi:hypothetical protein
MRLGAARPAAGRAAGFVEVRVPTKDEPLDRQTFRFGLKTDKLQEAELYDGHYLLRSNLTGKEPEWLWKLYMLLVQIEAVFKSFKNDLRLRPIYHRREPRFEAHIFVCFLAYCLYVTLQQRLKALAPGLTPRAVLDPLGGIQMLDVQMPTTDGRCLLMSRATQPEKAVALLLAKRQLQLPEQPRPRLSAKKKLLGNEFCSEDLLKSQIEK